MAESNLIVLSIPGLRLDDIDPRTTPALHGWANGGALVELVPTFPCVTSPVQASLWTGTPPSDHGVIANGFYERAKRDVHFWVGWNDKIAGESVWNEAKRRYATTCAVWHAQNIKGASCDYIVTPAPIHETDGTTKLWCYSKPESLYPELLEIFGHFPLQHYWGPMSGIQSTNWILDGAAWLAEKHSPRMQWIYIPHLDYAGQKFGPNSPQAKDALVQLDGALTRFVERMNESGRATFLAVGEYAMTDVSRVVYPNRGLREAGALVVRVDGERELIDFEASSAFAMVDHQFAHVYVQSESSSERGRRAEQIVELFKSISGIAGVYAGKGRREIGMDQPRAGDVVLVCEDDSWCAYYWWRDDALAPAFARTVDIHQKPGYDPVELFFDPVTKGTPLNANLVKGSHGVPATASRHRTAMICSRASHAVESGRTYRDVDVKRISLDLLGAGN